MTKRFKKIAFLLIGSWLLTSCSSRVTDPTRLPMSTPSSHTNVPAVIASQTTLPQLPQPRETAATDFQTAPVPSVMPEFVSLFGNSGQMMADGRLKLSIKQLNDKCYSPDSFIPMLLIYENLTSSSLSIVDYKIVDTHVLYNSNGQLFPLLSTSQNDPIITPYDLAWVDSFNPTSPLLQELPANTRFEVSVEYYLSAEIMKPNEKGQMQAQPIPPGQYFLRFVYSSRGQENAWEGTISSNQISICIIN